MNDCNCCHRGFPELNSLALLRGDIQVGEIELCDACKALKCEPHHGEECYRLTAAPICDGCGETVWGQVIEDAEYVFHNGCQKTPAFDTDDEDDSDSLSNWS